MQRIIKSKHMSLNLPYKVYLSLIMIKLFLSIINYLLDLGISAGNELFNQ